MRIETKCLHSGYTPKNGEPRALPIYQSTTFKFDSAEHIGNLFDLKAAGHFYSRLSNPTVDAVEQKIADLEGGVGALCTSSGQAASAFAVLNILQAGDHLISASKIYGGSLNLFAVTLKKIGIDVTFVDPDASSEEIQKAFKPNTKAVYGETISNPAITILDIKKFADIAHKNDVPLIIDNTLATPVLCRPIEHGADIVVHSTSKYLDGHAIQVGGVIVDGGNFNWANGKFPEFTTPDDSYHGLIYTEAFGKAAYIAKARVQLMRDLGACITATNAFYLNLGLETLPLRVQRHSENALKVAEFLLEQQGIEAVNYPGIKGRKDNDLTQKYLPDGASGVVSITFKGGKEAAIKFMDALELSSIVVHVSDIRTCVLHPASSSHRQLTDEQLKQAGVNPGLVRISVGIENINDIIEDFKKGLAAI